MQRRALSRVGRLTDVNINAQVAPGSGRTFGGGPLRRAEQLKQKLHIHGAESQGHWRGRATTGGNRAGANVMHGARSLYGGKQKHKDAPRCAGCGAAVPARTARSHIQVSMNRAPRRAVALDDKGTLRRQQLHKRLGGPRTKRLKNVRGRAGVSLVFVQSCF